MTLSQTIRRCRKDKGYSQECMADQLNVSQPTYNRIEHSEADCQKWLVRIAAVLSITTDDLHNYQSPEVGLVTAESADTLTEQLARQQTIIEKKEEEISFLKVQIQYMQAVWHQYCGGGRIMSRKPLVWPVCVRFHVRAEARRYVLYTATGALMTGCGL